MISAVSASSDTNDTSLGSNDLTDDTINTDSNMDKTSSNNNIQIENKDTNIDTRTQSSTKDAKINKNKQEKLSTTNKQDNTLKENNNPKTFTDLQNAINENITNENYEITLNYDYKYDGGNTNGITFGLHEGDNFTINGNGHTIDGNHQARIFVISKHVILKNLNLINGYDSYGGAIHNSPGCTLTIINCTFNNNTATDSGGAIMNEGTLVAINSTFNQNNATKPNAGGGGAIFNYASGTVNITNCIFNNNTATGVNTGGAISSSYGAYKLTVTNSTFNHNIAYEGGAIYNYEGTLEVTNSLFNHNSKPEDERHPSINSKNGGTVKNCAFISDYNINGECYGVTPESYIFSNDETSFTTLDAKINYGAHITNTINLEYDYTYTVNDGENYKNGITINKNRTINGNGHTINANQKGRIFNITSTGNLTLINCTLTGGQLTGTTTTRSQKGGAIYNHKGILNIINSTLTNNKIDGETNGNGFNGGAIYNSEGTVVIIDSNLTNNNITGSGNIYLTGGAIHNINGYMTITNSNINDNKIENGRNGGGGAIYNVYGYMTITNSNLTNNQIKLSFNPSIEYSGGGAIRNSGGTLTIINSNLNYNKVIDNNKNYGGAISNDAKLTIIDSILSDNEAAEGGSAIHNDKYGTFTIVNTTLTNNKIYFNGEDSEKEGLIDLLTTEFNINGIADVYEGLPVLINVTGLDTAYTCNLTVKLKNTTSDIPFIFNITVKNGEASTTKILPIGTYTATFTNLIIKDNGNNPTENFKVIGNNSFTALYNNITNSQNGQLTLTHNYIYDNRTDTNFESGINITKTFTINGNGYTIDGSNEARIFKVTNGAQLRLINITLTQGKGQNDGPYGVNVGGAIYATDNCNITITDSKITHNNADYGGAIYTENSHINITHTNITQNNTANHGGAICTENSHINITHTNITQNTANWGSGGAIYTSNSHINITHTNITQNTANWGSGGAIYTSNSHINITHTNITQNNANLGGAIYTYYNSHINITHTNITQNTALSGGAIYTYISHINITNTNITHNNANDGDGGAIVAEFNSHININNTNITQNNATYRGGAICTYNSQVNMSYTSFIKNTAKGTYASDGGGAIYADSNSTMAVSSSLFMDNTASNNGGAIYGRNFKNLTVNNNIFLNNTRNKEIYLHKEYSDVDFYYDLGCNWFGNNETNHRNKPDTVQLEDDIDHSSVRFDNWLFLTATGDSDSVTVFGEKNITFKLSQYDNNTGEILDYDNNLLYPVNLTVSYLNGNGDESVRLGDTVTFKPDTVGTGSVTANISNVRYTIKLTINKAEYDTKISNLHFDDLFEGKESLINGTLTANNTGFANQEITINITNDQSHIETYIGKTDNNGKFSIKIKPQVNGEVTITINYPGNQTDKIIYKPTTNTTTQTITLNKTSYKYLQTQITDAINNNKNNLTLNWDYKYDNDTDYEYIKGIPITTEFTIYGNNHTINGNNEARIFKVTGNGDLTLINITLTQGKGQNDGPNNWNVGGAIYTNNTNLTLINATLTENTAENEGGAIYTGNNCKININNTIFNNNQVTKAHGGAIYATESQTQINITKSLFNNNTANKGNGGAIYVFGPKLSIQNSTFNQNTAKEGGAIYAGTTQINIKQTLFNNNTANHGGAINSQYGAQISINNTLFNNNTATQSGGAIIAIGGSKLNINNTVINNNTATQSGGAIYAQEESTKINIKQTLFNNNTATWGGAIYTTTNTTLNIKQTLFNNNSAGMGGAIYTTTNTTLNIKQTLFNNNTANYGGSIAASDTSKINMIQTVLTNNTGLAGGAICIQLNCTLKMTKSLFDNNSASIGGAICTYINCTLNMTESLFDNNTALNGTNLCMLNGGSAYIKDTQIDEKDIYNNKTTTDSELARIEILTTLDKFKFNIIDFTQDTTTTISITEPNGFNGTAILIIGDSKEKVEFINGLANIKLNLKPGTYTATITDIEYYNDPNRNLTCTYLTSNNTTQFTVNNKPTPPSPEPTPTPTGKVATKILAKQKTFKLETKNKKYTITLKDTNGKIIKKAKVTLKIKGKTYKATTNNKGKATFKITKLNKKGKYTAKIQYKGNKKYKATNKKIKITVSFKTIGKNSKNKKMIKKIQKALKKNGYYQYEGKRYLKIDGIYHKYTQKAVTQYQKAKKLQVTGTVNYQTAKKLKII